MLMVVAPSLITVSSTRQRKSSSERLPSSGENSTSGHAFFAKRTASFAASRTCSGVMRSFFSMCSGLVAMKVWTRHGPFATFNASMPRWMSRSLARHRPQTTESWMTPAMARTAAKSPFEAGLPAAWYHDPAHYQRELEAFWYRRWVAVAREEELASAGDWRTVRIGTQSLVLVRDDDQVRAFHNTCRHRGSVLCTEAQGNFARKRIVCP